MTRFGDRLDAFLAELFRLDPLRATAAGMHAHDADWPDLGPAGRTARLAFYDDWRRRFETLADEDLTLDERVDRDLILLELASATFGETELREETWDPLAWVYVLGEGLFPLLAREFAALPDRLTSVAGRLEGFPTVIAEARAALVGHGDRPVSLLHTETALRQLSGIGDLVAEAVAMAEPVASEPNAAGTTNWHPRLLAAASDARAALDAFETHLRDVVLGSSAGEGRLGAELYARKLRHTLKSDRTAGEILERAQREYTAVRAEMIRLAGELWPVWLPETPRPEAGRDIDQDRVDRTVVRGVLDAIATAHSRPDELLDFCRAELSRIEAFVAQRELLELSDEPLEIRWTPVFLRAFGGAMLDAPGPLDHGQKSFFSITPIPEDWTPEQAESYLREDNDRMLRLLTIHEAVPGHYLQQVYGNRCPSLARQIFWSGVFAEGWAVYVTQVMMDEGYDADDPALLLVHWKFYLRAVTNAIVDIGIHTGTMTEAEAIELMIDGGFQEESEARNKWNRARLTSTQLSTYFVGSIEMWDLELEVRRRAAVAAGDPGGTDAVAEPLLVGGFGDTPGFDYRRHLKEVISHGSPPMALLRRILLTRES